MNLTDFPCETILGIKCKDYSRNFGTFCKVDLLALCGVSVWPSIPMWFLELIEIISVRKKCFLVKIIYSCFYYGSMLTREESLERFEDEDRNKDGKVSWEEHFAENFGEGSILHEHHEEDVPRMLEEDRELFALADDDRDGLLSKEEFPAFSHPHEFSKMHMLLVNHTMRRKDTNKDGKLTLEEYLKEDSGREMSEEVRVTEKDRFELDLDRNRDGNLDLSEVKHWIIPDNNDIADQEVEHLMENSDSDKDGRLSIQEIIDHHEIFVGSEATDYGEHLHKFKDEL